MRGPLLSAAAILVLLPACQAPAGTPEGDLLDREYAEYRAGREERRLSDLEARAAKARAEADRLEAELKAALAEIEAKRVRLSDATKARLRLPDPIHVQAETVPPEGTPAKNR